MVKTGYIAFISESGGGQDSNFNPTPVVKTTSDFIECNLAVATQGAGLKYIVVDSGEVKPIKYTCIIDSDKISSLNINVHSVKEISLQGNRGNSLGDFRVINIEYLELVKRVKIVV